MALRICLSGLTGHVSSHVTLPRSSQPTAPWGDEFVKVRDKAKELATALDQVLGVMCPREKNRLCFNLPGVQFCRLKGMKSSVHDKGFEIHVNAPDMLSSSEHRIEYLEIEAILSLALWSLISDRRMLYSEVGSRLDSSAAEDVQTKRIISANPDPLKLNAGLELAYWSGMPRNLKHKFDEVAIPLQTDLNSFGLGSLWQHDDRYITYDGRFTKEKWREASKGAVEYVGSSSTTRLCGWTCVLKAKQNIQSNKQSWSAKALGHARELPEIIWVQLATTANPSLLDICAQELFGAFLAQLQMQLDDHDNCASGREDCSVQLPEERVDTIKAISQIFLGSRPGSDADALACILPALENRQLGDRDRIISLVSSTCNSYLKKSDQRGAIQAVNYAIEALCRPETREEARFFARALCILSKAHRFILSIAQGPEIDEPLLFFLRDLWQYAILGCDSEVFPQLTFWELYNIHLPLGQWREVHEGARKIVCDTLLKALHEKDRSETLYRLCFLTNNSLDSCLAETHQCVSAALPLAAKQGWFEAVDALLDIGVDPLAEDEAGRTALSYCAEYAQFQHEVCAEVILRYRNALEASKSISWLADGGRTPLLWAITHGNDEMVKILLERGFPLVEQGSWRVSPLTEAFSRGFEGIALQLIDAGAELRREHLALAVLDSPLQSLAVACLRAQMVEFGDYWFQQMLEIIVDNDSDSLQLLFNLGIGVEFCHIVLAIRTGHHEVKQLFLDGFPGWVDANQHRTKHGLRRLEENDDHEIMQALLDHGGSAVWDHTQI